MIKNYFLAAFAILMLFAFSPNQSDAASDFRWNDYARANRPKVKEIAQKKLDAAFEEVTDLIPEGYEFEKAKYNYITDIEPSLGLENYLIAVPVATLPWADFDAFQEAAKKQPRLIAMIYTDFELGDFQGYYLDPEESNIFMMYYGITNKGKETIAFLDQAGEPIYTDIDDTKLYKVECELVKGEDKEFPRVRFNLPPTIFRANMRLPLRFENERVSFLHYTKDDQDNPELDGFFRIRTTHNLFTDNVL